MSAMPEKIDLAHAFGLAPEKAVAYFKAKGYAINWDWWETWQEAHNKAFTVAKVTRMDILEDIRGAVAKTLTEGTTYEQFRREIEPKLKAKGWWGKQKVTGADGQVQEVTLGSPWRLRTIFRTNLQTAIAAGRWKDFAANSDKRPYLQFVCVLDNFTRPSHRLLHGKVFHISDPIWRKLAPPLDWGCRCRLRALSAEEVKSRGLKVESSEGRLSTEDRLVSEATGELRPVTVYTDPKSGKRVSTGVGWDYNPGEGQFDPAIAKRTPDLVEAMKKEVKTEGLAKRFPVKAAADVEKLLRAYDSENPGSFPFGIESVTIRRSKKFLMSTTRGGRIAISNHPFGDVNAKTDFFSAIKKIPRGEALTFNEEYSIESMWHEMGHTRSKGWVETTDFTDAVMETLNQFVARHTYPEFMKRLGGTPAHHQAIIENGHGYRYRVRNFRLLLSHLGVDEQVALGLLREDAVETDWNALPDAIAGKLTAHIGETVGFIHQIKFVLGYIKVKNEDEVKRVFEKYLGEARGAGGKP